MRTNVLWTNFAVRFYFNGSHRRRSLPSQRPSELSYNYITFAMVREWRRWGLLIQTIFVRLNKTNVTCVSDLSLPCASAPIRGTVPVPVSYSLDPKTPDCLSSAFGPHPFLSSPSLRLQGSSYLVPSYPNSLNVRSFPLVIDVCVPKPSKYGGDGSHLPRSEREGKVTTLLTP